jgi:hypothetical protein
MIVPTVLVSYALLGTALAQGVPAVMSEAQTGVFGAGNATSTPKIGKGGISISALAAEAIKFLPLTMVKDNSGGSGLYKAGYTAAPGLVNHTIYAPKTLPPGVQLPVIVWGNGACSGKGTWFSKFLTEIASHGYYIVANGAIDGSMTSSTTAQDLPNAIDWVFANAGTGALATVDKTRLAAAGQSCGGIQAYSASLDPRVKLTGIFNSGLLNHENTPLFEKLHAPIGYFLGGPTDIAYANVSSNYMLST